ncbi:hypothetical protein TNCV_1576391 [Trichonephila clavipes]|nr:hypothetical protein TNCV_1576391 [Trichonephila clavipes]
MPALIPYLDHWATTTLVDQMKNGNYGIIVWAILSWGTSGTIVHRRINPNLTLCVGTVLSLKEHSLQASANPQKRKSDCQTIKRDLSVKEVLSTSPQLMPLNFVPLQSAFRNVGRDVRFATDDGLPLPVTCRGDNHYRIY